MTTFPCDMFWHFFVVAVVVFSLFIFYGTEIRTSYKL